jgi:hypothetical protein
MTVPLSAQHLLQVADANGNSYGNAPPTITDIANTIRAIGTFPPSHTKPAFAAGDGGTVTQSASKATGVTLNKLSGQITMNGAALAAGAEVTFTVTNNQVASTDVPVACVQSVGTAGGYLVSVGAVANGSFAITVSNASAGSLSQALVLNFVIIKGVAS